jgi:hypothetical protein
MSLPRYGFAAVNTNSCGRSSGTQTPMKGFLSIHRTAATAVALLVSCAVATSAAATEAESTIASPTDAIAPMSGRGFATAAFDGLAPFVDALQGQAFDAVLTEWLFDDSTAATATAPPVHHHTRDVVIRQFNQRDR